MCLKFALAFVFTGNGHVYQLNPDQSKPKVDIFFLKLLAILSTVHHIACFEHSPRRLFVFMDSLNAVAVFNSLGALENMHNSVLRAAAGIVIETWIDLHVCHIASKDNT